MKTLLKCLAIVLLLLSLWACGTNTDLDNDPDQTDVLLFGTDNTLDIVTWNLREFPWLGQTTLDALAQIIPRVRADIIAFQEINDFSSFMALDAMLPDYQAYVSTATSSYRLAYLYNINTVAINEDYFIYPDQGNPFPRPPYIVKAEWRGQNYYVINNHLKAFGDNFIDETDDWDEEVRRRLACQLLDQYIRTELPDERVVVLGDMNDQIQEPEAYNVFMVFLNRPEEYYFTTMPIALAPSFNTVSYPNSNSQIDQIMITNELFDEFATGGSICKSLLIEKFYGNWVNYSNQISDHRPVGIRLAE
jgi:endonuclease/exonuclease/phosphatase family metal-dependent hydrolase